MTGVVYCIVSMRHTQCLKLSLGALIKQHRKEALDLGRLIESEFSGVKVLSVNMFDPVIEIPRVSHEVVAREISEKFQCKLTKNQKVYKLNK